VIAGALGKLFRVRVGWLHLLRRAVVEMYRDNCLGLAAQLAYYFFLALFPALLFVVALASFFPLDRTMPEVLDAARPFLPGEVVSILRDQLAKISQGHHGGILTFGLLAALWSSSAAVTAIIEALNRAYQVEEGRAWWRVRLTAIALTLALAVLIVVSLALVLVGPTVIERLVPGVPALLWACGVARWLLAFALVALAIGLVYYFAPDVEQEWVWLTPGSILATVTWILASLAFKLYLVRDAALAVHLGAGHPGRGRAQQRDRARLGGGEGSR
jgi:membrane protein